MKTLQALDTAVQELRLEQHRSAFTQKLGHMVGTLGEIPDWAPADMLPADMARLRELAEETVDAIENRIDSGADGIDVQQQLAGTVYEIRKRMEAIELWFRHNTS
jgi:hypothetical protein